MSKEKHQQDQAFMRLDKWLWAARFFKTRALSQRHIELGRVKVNGAKVKNSKTIHEGDVIDLMLNSLPFKIKVLALNHQRRPAPEARLLYEEDEATVTLRNEQKMLHKLVLIGGAPEGRPTKKDRRELTRFKRKRGHFSD